MDATLILKGIVGLIASASTSTVVNNIIKMNTPDNLKTYGKVMTIIGGFIIGGIAADQAEKYVGTMFDKFVGVKKEPEDFSI